MSKLSFIIPCYRSEKTIEKVVEEINEAVSKLDKYTHEIILVNDCSPDNTIEVLKKLSNKYEFVTTIDFARNFGQHSALMAGLREARGDIAICLDDDGQTPADECYKLINALEEGADAVYAKYAHKKHSLFRNFGSFINEEMARFMLDKPKELYVSSYFAVRRYIIDDMIRYENSYPYVIGLVLRATNNIVNVDINHRAREIGESGYSFKKLLGLWLNGFTSFSIKPLRMATIIGAICSVIGIIYGIIVIIQRIVLPDRQLGFASIESSILFIGGVVLIMLGLIGEYVGRIYISMNATPQYVIKRIYRNDVKKTEDESEDKDEVNQ